MVLLSKFILVAPWTDPIVVWRGVSFNQVSSFTSPNNRGFDVVQPRPITMSSTSTPYKSPWSLKVNSFLYENPFRAQLEGILREHLPLYYARFDTTRTDVKGDAEEAQASRPSKAYAWKRRRKRQDEDEEGGGARQAGLQPGLGRLPGRPYARDGRPPGRPPC